MKKNPLCSTVALFLTMLACTPTPTLGEAVFIVAHRGASADAPENTLPSFDLAWERGADAIEGDFYLTQDEKIVCIHDADTERTTGLKKAVKETTLEELQKLDAGSWKGEQWKGTHIPTLAEVFKTIPNGKKIFIEIKIGPEIIPTLLEEIKKAGLKDEQVVIISFNAEVIHAVKAQAPQFKANWLVGIKRDEAGKLNPPIEKVLSVLQQTGADGLSSNSQAIDQPYIQQIMDAGYAYHVWTVNDLATARRFQKWGTKSITTNVPQLLGALND